jgi:hypothetical protein
MGISGQPEREKKRVKNGVEFVSSAKRFARLHQVRSRGFQ